MFFEGFFEGACSKEGMAAVGNQVALLKDTRVGRSADPSRILLSECEGYTCLSQTKTSSCVR